MGRKQRQKERKRQSEEERKAMPSILTLASELPVDLQIQYVYMVSIRESTIRVGWIASQFGKMVEVVKLYKKDEAGWKTGFTSVIRGSETHTLLDAILAQHDV